MQHASSLSNLFVALRNLVYMTGFILFWGWIALRVRNFDKDLGISLPDAVVTIGVGVMLIGSLIALGCAVIFIFIGRGTVAPFDAPRTFVTVGLYCYVRNPMYLGGLLILVGFALFEQSISILLFCPVWLLLAHLFVIFYEEPTLAQRFGAAYETYRQSVNRWIPKLKPYRSV